MPDVKMNYNSMEAMAKAFKAAHSQVVTSKGEMGKIAKSMEDGALLGDAGKAFVEIIKTKLMKRMDTIAEKMAELEQDINGAVSTTRDGVSNAKGRFNN